MASPLRLPVPPVIATALAWRAISRFRSASDPLLPLAWAVDVSLSPLRHAVRPDAPAAWGVPGPTGADLPSPAAAAAAARAAVALPLCTASADRVCRTPAALLPSATFEGDGGTAFVVKTTTFVPGCFPGEALLGECAADEENRLLCATLWCGDRLLGSCSLPALHVAMVTMYGELALSSFHKTPDKSSNNMSPTQLQQHP